MSFLRRPVSWTSWKWCAAMMMSKWWQLSYAFMGEEVCRCQLRWMWRHITCGLLCYPGGENTPLPTLILLDCPHSCLEITMMELCNRKPMVGSDGYKKHLRILLENGKTDSWLDSKWHGWMHWHIPGRYSGLHCTVRPCACVVHWLDLSTMFEFGPPLPHHAIIRSMRLCCPCWPYGNKLVAVVACTKAGQCSFSIFNYINRIIT